MPSRFIHRCVLLLGLVLAPSIGGLSTALAQSPPEPGTTARLSTLGLTVEIPLSAVAQDRSRGEQVDFSLMDRSTPAAWSLRLLTMTSPAGLTTASEQIGVLLEARRERTPDLTILVNDLITCGIIEGRLCLVDSGKDPNETVSGWFCLPLGDGVVLLATLQARSSELSRVLPVLRETFASIRAPDLTAAAAELAGRMEAGKAFLEGLDETTLRGLTGTRQWYRTFRAGSPGAPEKEIGCFYVEVDAAFRGSVDLSRDPSTFVGMERDEGLLVRLWSEILTDKPDSRWVTIGSYWLSWTQAEEIWSVRQSLRSGRRRDSTAISGVRTRSTVRPASQLQVIRLKHNGRDRDAPPEWMVPDPCFSQALRWIDGALYNRIADEPTALSYYCADTSTETLAVSVRTDTITRISPEVWQLSSQPSPDSPATESRYSQDGTLIRRTWPDSSVSEPIELADLIALWKRKGIGAESLGEKKRRRSPSRRR